MSEPKDTPTQDQVAEQQAADSSAALESLTGVEMSDDGELQLNWAGEPEEGEADAEESTEELATEDGESEEVTPQEKPAKKAKKERKDTPPQPDKGSWEERYKEVQGWATRVAQENSDFRKRIEALEVKGDPKKEEEAEPDYEELFSDPKKIQTWLDGQVEARLKEKLDKYSPVLEKQALQDELNSALAAHEDFLDVLPTVYRIYSSLPKGQEMSFEQAYQLAKTLQPAPTQQEDEDDSEGEEENVESQTVKKAVPERAKVSVEAMKAKASRVATETGVAGTNLGEQEEGSAKTPRQAVEMAMRELLAQR